MRGNCRKELRGPQPAGTGYLMINIVWLTLSGNSTLVNFLPHLRRVPNAMRPETRSTVCLRLTWTKIKDMHSRTQLATRLTDLDHLWQGDHCDEEHYSSPIGKHGHSGGRPLKSKLCPALNWSPGVPDERLKSDFDALENPPDGRTIHKTEQGYTSASCIRGVLVDQHFLLQNPKAQIEKKHSIKHLNHRWWSSGQLFQIFTPVSTSDYW